MQCVGETQGRGRLDTWEQRIRKNPRLPSRAGRAIAEQIAKAGGETASGLGLRFDRVVVRVLRDLSRFAEASALARTTVIVTLTAPIRSPAKTVSALEQESMLCCERVLVAAIGSQMPAS